MFKVYGEELDFVFTEVRKKGCRRLIIDGKRVDLSDEARARRSPRSEHMDAVVDRFVVSRKHEKAIKAGIAAALLVGDGLIQVQRRQEAPARPRPTASTGACAAPRHHFVYGDITPSTSCSTTPRAPAAPAAASASTS